MSVLQHLFVKEHNTIIDRLKVDYPNADGEWLFQKAKLINGAILAKIHTVEWTPAILATEIIDVGLKSNWYGAPKDPLTQFGLWLTDVHALKGIPETEIRTSVPPPDDMAEWWRFLQWKHDDSLKKAAKAVCRGLL